MLPPLANFRREKLAVLLLLGPLASFVSSLSSRSAYGEPLPGLPAVDSPAGWTPYKVQHCIAVQRRSVPGSRFFEYRAVVFAPLAPETVLEQTWRHMIEGRPPLLKQRQVLKQDPDEIILYDQLKTPMVSDRDYTLMVRRQTDASRRRYQVAFATANELGPPLTPKHVRIPVIRGRWVVEPDEQGGSRLSYQSFVEPGGSLPSFLVHGAQLEQLVHDIEELMGRVEQIAEANGQLGGSNRQRSRCDSRLESAVTQSM